MNRVLFVAAENAALPGGKVGGIGDVVRDLPLALADEGCELTVICPAYGYLHKLPGARKLGSVATQFAGRVEQVTLFEVPGTDPRVTHRVLEHPRFSPMGAGKIYCDDGPLRPFASDADKFAFFCAAVAAYIKDQEKLPAVVHLHDWHTAFLLLLRAFSADCRHLRALRFVYTIHNLALQGIRPLADDPSSLAAWFPALDYDLALVSDQRYPDCINPMAMAIRLADRVNTVSPTYAREILQPNDPATGFLGGEGLERDTRAAAAAGRLVGILNGCMYAPGRSKRRGWRPLAKAITALPETLQATPPAADLLSRFARRRPKLILTSIGRITAQKVQLLLAETQAGTSALEAILERLGSDSLFVILGSGDTQLEQKIAAIVAQHANALFICGYDEELSEYVYDCGDLFVMPSSFEPCGISQMLAMRSGQPCVVHGVGGLRDTVIDGETGFVFAGSTQAGQARAFVNKVAAALTVHEKEPERWRQMRRAAAAQRFSWPTAARAYIEKLYAADEAAEAGADYAVGP